MTIYPLDRFDIAMLATLQRQGRLSNRELADRVGLSPAPCWRRLRALEQSGVIGTYAALLEPAKLGLNIIAFVHVSLENHHADSVAQFLQVIAGSPQVLECYMTSGDSDYMLKVVAADMATYQDFLSNVILPVRAVRTVNTSFALKHNKLTTALPLPHRD